MWGGQLLALHPSHAANLSHAVGSQGGQGWARYLCEGGQLCVHEGEELSLGELAVVTVLPSIPLEDRDQRLDAPLGLGRAGHFCLWRKKKSSELRQGGKISKGWMLENIPKILSLHFGSKPFPKRLGPWGAGYGA